MTLKTVYVFGGSADHSDPRQKDKTVAGGKGANLAEMASIGLPVPPEVPFESAGLSPMAASFWAESKRVSTGGSVRSSG